MNITDKLKHLDKKCCGCTACFAICPEDSITMQEDSEGFKYPVVDKDKCIDCGLCCKVCPVDKRAGHVADDKNAFACTAKDENFTEQSSSGGVFAILANMFLEKQAMIYGAAFDDNWTVKHIRVETANDLRRLYTSKYVQSDLGDIFKQVKADLVTGREVLFAGTPCQVAGLKSYLGKAAYDNLTTVDFICHGVPSPLVWKRYINELEQKLKNKIVAISFRNKKDGWKNFCFMVKNDKDIVRYENSGDNIYMQGFLKNLYLRPSCCDCNFKGLKRVSDITLADFWGVEKILPEMDTKRGVSLCWSNSEKGDVLLKSILEKTIYNDVSLIKAVKRNISAVKSVVANKNRDKFFQELNTANADVISIIEKYYDDRSLRKRLSYKIRTKLKSLFR